MTTPTPDRERYSTAGESMTDVSASGGAASAARPEGASKSDLVSWLRSVLDERERIARTVAERYIDQRDGTPYWPLPSIEARYRQGYDAGITAGLDLIKTYNATHVLRIVQGHRAILRLYENALYAASTARVVPSQTIEDRAAVDVLDAAVRALASIYEDRPGFDPSWRAE